jgi:hypothetical protein
MDIHSNDELSETVVAGMRSVYAPPREAAYWHSLERRIIARLGEAPMTGGRDASSWSVLARWAAPGLTAAALILAATTAIWSRMDQAEMESTYEGFTQPMIADAMPASAELLDIPRDGSSQREATLTYVLSH